MQVLNGLLLLDLIKLVKSAVTQEMHVSECRYSITSRNILRTVLYILKYAYFWLK